nr:divalent metal cation transporter [Paraburkholderia hospita]
MATYSQAGGPFGLKILWSMPAAFPLVAAAQLMCARIGRVTEKGSCCQPQGGISSIHPAGRRGVATGLPYAHIAAIGRLRSRYRMTVIFAFWMFGLQKIVPYHPYVFVLKCCYAHRC